MDEALSLICRSRTDNISNPLLQLLNGGIDGNCLYC